MFQNVPKLSLLFIVLVVFATGANSTDDYDDGTYCDGEGWIVFRDEKCFKLIKKWATVTDAKVLCAQESISNDSSIPKLVSIKSPDEQNFLTDYIFNSSGVDINVWTGAKRVDNSSNQFVWHDGSSMEYYTNWAIGSPTEESKSGCMVMKSRVFKNEKQSKEIGKWRDITCETPSYVICEKLPRWSFGKLQAALFEQKRKQLVTQNELIAAKAQLSEKVELLKENTISIGFIYTQLPNQKTPFQIWPSMDWRDVSSSYAGVFFRVVGSGSGKFGEVQGENSPRLTSVRNTDDTDNPEKCDNPTHSGITPGVWSGFIRTGSFGSGKICMQFYVAGGEVRPRNMAIRIWERTG